MVEFEHLKTGYSIERKSFKILDENFMNGENKASVAQEESKNWIITHLPHSFDRGMETSTRCPDRQPARSKPK